MSKRRITAVLILAVATGITAVIAVKSGINPPGWKYYRVVLCHCGSGCIFTAA